MITKEVALRTLIPVADGPFHIIRRIIDVIPMTDYSSGSVVLLSSVLHFDFLGRLLIVIPFLL